MLAEVVGSVIETFLSELVWKAGELSPSLRRVFRRARTR
jgi:hypothetical protein